MATGRQIFRLTRPIFDGINAVLGVVPRGIIALFWPLVQYFPWKLGIALRYIFARRLMKHCGANAQILPGVTILNWQGISLGDNVSIHTGCYLEGLGGLTIGNDVSIAHATSLLTFEHGWEDKDIPIKYNALKLGAVRIEDDVWLGCGVRILSNVHIKSRAIVAAGSVVRAGTLDSGVWAGVPAQLRKSLT